MPNENENNKKGKITLSPSQIITILAVLFAAAAAYGVWGYKANEALEIAKANQEKITVLERIDERLNNIEKAIERIEQNKSEK